MKKVRLVAVKNLLLLLSISSALCLLAGCASMPTGEQVPDVNFAKSSIGKHMSLESQDKLRDLIGTGTSEQMQTWQEGSWTYEFMPTETYINTEGFPCRKFELTARGTFRNLKTHGLACRDLKGQWDILSN